MSFLCYLDGYILVYGTGYSFNGAETSALFLCSSAQVMFSLKICFYKNARAVFRENLM